MPAERLIRSLQPHALIAFKHGATGEEDFAAPEGRGAPLLEKVRKNLGEPKAEKPNGNQSERAFGSLEKLLRFYPLDNNRDIKLSFLQQTFYVNPNCRSLKKEPVLSGDMSNDISTSKAKNTLILKGIGCSHSSFGNALYRMPNWK